LKNGAARARGRAGAVPGRPALGRARRGLRRRLVVREGGRRIHGGVLAVTEGEVLCGRLRPGEARGKKDDGRDERRLEARTHDDSVSADCG
jgi:hypothetical protein